MTTYALRTLHEVSCELRVTTWTLRAWIKQGKLHAVRLGRRLLVTQAELDHQIAAGSTSKGSAR